jgi:hypothetical protein
VSGIDNFSTVIPGRIADANPEPMHTDFAGKPRAVEPQSAQTVFMGSGLDPLGRPGMTPLDCLRPKRILYLDCRATDYGDKRLME